MPPDMVFSNMFFSATICANGGYYAAAQTCTLRSTWSIANDARGVTALKRKYRLRPSAYWRKTKPPSLIPYIGDI